MNGIGVATRSFFSPVMISFLTIALALFWMTGRPAEAKDQKIVAAYDISFNGLGIGDFKLVSNFWKDNYVMKGRASISILGGLLFEWRGDTESNGRLHSRGPRPASFTFDFRTSDKRGRIDLAFSGNRVTQLDVSPPQRKSSRHVPLERAHMQGVVDPLSAIVMLSKTGLNKSSRQVCSGTIPVFDGNTRYDLRLSYKKTQTVQSSYGYNGKAFICKVKFVPIAGHKRGDDESEFAAKSNGIEVWMVPLKKAGIYAPHFIQIPTLVGTARITASSFEVGPVERQDAMLQQ
jgi:hypothetical protein